MSNKATERFATLFRGLSRAYGIYRNSRAKTVREPVTLDHYDQHLNGSLGVGIIPIDENNNCHFAAIDIDINDIDHEMLVKKVDSFKFPLMVCRSKSGGAHLYTFTRNPIQASLMRKIMSKFAAELGHGGAEIFPKQNALGPQDVGNWINLPYFNFYGACNRYAIDKDGEMIFAKFLDLADALADSNDLTVYGNGELEPDGMPPCLSHFYHAGVGEGGRNDVLYSFGVFAKKSEQPDLEDFLFQMNYKVFDPPLPTREVKVISQSVGKKDYQYKCKQPAFRAHCNKEACRRLRFGIGQEDTGDYDDHMIGCLTKYTTNPVRWIMDINGVDVEFNTEELMNYQKVRCLSMERANIIAPPMRQEAWLLLLKERLEHVRIVDAPDDATINGDLTQVLFEFIQISERAHNGRDDLVRGIPVQDLIWENGEKVPVVMFRSQDLLTYIKRRKININMTNNVLWMHLRQMGIGHSKIKISGSVIQVWYIHVSPDYSTPIFEPISPVLDI
jgi:hypothetical protein